jgi:hypothetical protein
MGGGASVSGMCCKCVALRARPAGQGWCGVTRGYLDSWAHLHAVLLLMPLATAVPSHCMLLAAADPDADADADADVQETARDCGLQDVVPVAWVDRLQGALPGSNFVVDWDGLWMELAEGLSLQNLVDAGGCGCGCGCGCLEGASVCQGSSRPTAGSGSRWQVAPTCCLYPSLPLPLHTTTPVLPSYG